MKIVYLTHSLVSCWNHGNAHFLRGVLRELKRRGHAVEVLEPRHAWSRENLQRDHGDAGFASFRRHYPDLTSDAYGPDTDLSVRLAGADVVLVHEWNDPAAVAAIGRIRRSGGRFTLLFHDTHHRAVSDPAAIRTFDLDGYDGVLAFGRALAEVYRRWGWGDRVRVWHEAADISVFRPPAEGSERRGLVWIGNFGDGERTEEIAEFLLRPADRAGLPLDIYGVRYPDDVLQRLARHGALYRGWLANAEVPEVFARHLATVHVPRRFYATHLPGIPTIRVFEALACGIPLVSDPWHDAERLFRPGSDYLLARDGLAMKRHLSDLANDADLRRSLAASGLETVRRRHTCAHRVDELLATLNQWGVAKPLEMSA
jgi:spore maturation protein CgeB